MLMKGASLKLGELRELIIKVENVTLHFCFLIFKLLIYMVCYLSGIERSVTSIKWTFVSWMEGGVFFETPLTIIIYWKKNSSSTKDSSKSRILDHTSYVP